MSACVDCPLTVVEDSDEDFAALSRALRDILGPDQIRRFHSGEEAIDRLADPRRIDVWPPLLLLDLNLPGCSGFDVLAALRRDPSMRALPVVVVSGSRRQEDIDRAYRDGANAYLVKPLEFAELKQMLLLLLEFCGVVSLPTSEAGQP